MCYINIFLAVIIIKNIDKELTYEDLWKQLNNLNESRENMHTEDFGCLYEENTIGKDCSESDYIKNDGKYLYVPNETMDITIYECNEDNLTEVSRIDNNYIDLASDFYVEGNFLIEFTDSNNTEILIYDISDRKNPKLISKNIQSGAYLHSKIMGDYVNILVRGKYIYIVNTTNNEIVNKISL